MRKRGKKAQVTIFIILAVIIVALGILIFLFFPKIKTSLGFGVKNPNDFIQSCLQKEIKDSVDKLSLQGGSLNPELYFKYNNSDVSYLCYTNAYYSLCNNQQPLLKEHIESEIKKNINKKASECFKDLKKAYISQGYKVNLIEKGVDVELLPKRIVVSFNNTLALTKQNTETYNNIRVILRNNLYELIAIAESILNYEARVGNAETTTYMDYYHDLKVEKKIPGYVTDENKKEDGTKIYIITDRNTGNKFQFAVRSLVWPSGYI